MTKIEFTKLIEENKDAFRCLSIINSSSNYFGSPRYSTIVAYFKKHLDPVWIKTMKVRDNDPKIIMELNKYKRWLPIELITVKNKSND